MTIRILALAALAAAFSTPALAQDASDTLKAVTTHGQAMSGSMQGFDIVYTTTFAADGTYVAQIPAMDRTMTGKWRIDGDKLCTKGDSNPIEDCTAYPAGRKAGDMFDVEHPRLGPAKVTINPAN